MLYNDVSNKIELKVRSSIILFSMIINRQLEDGKLRASSESGSGQYFAKNKSDVTVIPGQGGNLFRKCFGCVLQCAVVCCRCKCVT